MSRRHSAHLFTYRLQRHGTVGFDDDLIVDMGDDRTAAEGLHGIEKNVPTRSLHDVFDQLRAVRFQPFPLSRVADALIGDGLSAEAVLSDAGSYIGKPSARRQLYKKKPALIGEADTRCGCSGLAPDGSFCRPVDRPPKLQCLGLAAAHESRWAAVQLSLRPISTAPMPSNATYGASVAAGQLRIFPFAQLTV